MSNTTSNTSISDDDGAAMFATYYPVALVILGTVLNLFTFTIFWGPTFQDTNKRPTIH